MSSKGQSAERYVICMFDYGHMRYHKVGSSYPLDVARAKAMRYLMDHSKVKRLTGSCIFIPDPTYACILEKSIYEKFGTDGVEDRSCGHVELSFFRQRQFCRDNLPDVSMLPLYIGNAYWIPHEDKDVFAGNMLYDDGTLGFAFHKDKETNRIVFSDLNKDKGDTE